MFYKDKKIDSIADAVRKITEAEKVQTPTGMKVYGSSYGNSQKARADQTKKEIDTLKGPKAKEMKEELKGNQDKIDANHNQKIDAQDFKILRGKKKMKEGYSFADRLIDHAIFAEEVEEEINEVLSKDASAGDWIHDFVHSDNPKFKGKSKAERKKMALGAYYAKQNEEKDYGTHGSDKEEEGEDVRLIKKMVKKDALKKEEVEQVDECGMVPTPQIPEETPARKSIKAKEEHEEVKPATIHAKESFEEEHGIGRDIADKKEKMDRLKTPAKPGPLHNVAKGFKAFIQGKKEPMESVNVEGEVIEEKEKWIQKAIKKPGALHKQLHVPAGEKIPASKLSAAAEKGGKLGKRARLAQTLKGLHKEETIEEKKDLSPGQDDAPFEPPYTTGKPDNVKDKSGAVHTPMSRARDLARSALKRVKNEMLGKAPGNN